MKTRTVFLTLTLEIFEIDNNERKQIENRKKKPKLKKKILSQHFLFYRFFKRLLNSC